MATSDSPLNVPNVTLSVTRQAGSGGGSVEPNLLFDGLETGDISAPNGPAPAKNLCNFRWATLWNAIVTDISGDGTTGARLYNGSGPVEPPSEAPGRDWRAKEGDNSLLLSIAGGTDTMAEQTFFLDPQPERDLWVKYWWRIPFNYTPSDHSTSQHKIFVLFQDGYSVDGNGATCFMNIYQSAEGMMQSGLLQRTGSSGAADGVGPKADLFHPTNDRGRWMEFVIQHRLESSPNANDGEHRFWARFDGESFALKNETTGLNLMRSTTAGKEGWAEGRIMSAREGFVAEREDYLVDSLQLSSQPLVPAGTEGLS